LANIALQRLTGRGARQAGELLGLGVVEVVTPQALEDGGRIGVVPLSESTGELRERARRVFATSALLTIFPKHFLSTSANIAQSFPYCSFITSLKFMIR
jgi:hypothetical protein